MQKQIKALDRAGILEGLRQGRTYDVVVIGAGAIGLGVALDAASRGFSTLVVDAQDFCAGTSSRCTKMSHGSIAAVRNPRNWSLVKSSLFERRLMVQNASQLARPARFAVPCYGFWQKPLYTLSLAVYSAMGGPARGMRGVSVTNRIGALCELPGIARKALKGAVSYSDAVFDDARYGLALMQTAVAYGADALNYMQADAFEFDADGRRLQSVTLTDRETGEKFKVGGTVFFNCAGVWVDSIRRLADVGVGDLVRVVRGTHIVVDKSFMPGETGMAVPVRGGMLYCVPWNGMLEIGSTYIPQGQSPFDQQPTQDEIDFLIAGANRCLSRNLRREDVSASFSGLRSVFDAKKAGFDRSSAIVGRDSAAIAEFGNMITIAGGKWTRYRALAEDGLRLATQKRLLPRKGCMTRSLPLSVDMTMNPAGIDDSLLQIGLSEDVLERVRSYARYCVSVNGARNARDVVLRRLRIGQLDARRTAEIMPEVEKAVSEALSAASSKASAE